MAEPIEKNPVHSVATHNAAARNTDTSRIGDDVNLDTDADEVNRLSYEPDRGDRMAEYAAYDEDVVAPVVTGTTGTTGMTDVTPVGNANDHVIGDRSDRLAAQKAADSAGDNDLNPAPAAIQQVADADPTSGTGGDEVAATRAQIEETRAHLSDTIDAIKEKLSPAHIVEEAKESVKHAASDMVGDAKDAVKDKASQVVSSVTETAKNVAASASMVASAAVAQVNELAHSAVEAAHNVIGGAGDKAKTTVRSTAASASDLAGRATTTAKGAGTTVVDTIRMNPLPAALIGIGAGWLLMSIRKQDNLASRYEANLGSRDLYSTPRVESESAGYVTTNYNTYDTAENRPSVVDRAKGAVSGVGDKAGDLASTAKDKVSDIAGTAKEKVTDIAGTAKDKVSDLASTVSDKASSLYGTAADKASGLYSSTADTVHNAGVAAKEKGQQAYSALDSWVHENPVAAGAAALLVGVAVGLMLPTTRKENELLGPTRDRLMDQASTAASDVAHKAQRVAEAALGTAKDTLSDAKDKVKDKIQHEAQSQGLTSEPPAEPHVAAAY